MTRLTITPIYEFRFEGAALDDWSTSVGGGGAIDTGVFYRGAQSIYFDCTGSAKANHRSFAASKRICVASMYYRPKADTSGTASIIQTDGPGIRLQARPGQKLRVQINATNSVDSAALTLDRWYLIDIYFDASAATATASYSIDGVAQTGTSVAQAAADMTTFRLGNTGTATLQNYWDELVITHTAADYPIGPLSAKRSLMVAA